MSLVAKRYSEAFFSLALDKNKVSEYKEDLKLVLDTFKGVDSIDLFFASEKITKQEKKDLIEKSFNEKFLWMPKICLNYWLIRAEWAILQKLLRIIFI